MAHILAVEDDQLFGTVLCEALQSAGHSVEWVKTLALATQRIAAEDFDLVLLDVSLPDGHGPSLIPMLRDLGGPRVICVTAHAGIPAVVDAMRAGAYDYIEKGQPASALLSRVRMALPRRGGFEQESEIEQALLGSSASMAEVRRMTSLASQTGSTVLICGETGTGKSHIARLIHQLSPRKNQPFITVDCAALSESLAESQLFGHERGAFTGAINRHLGAIESAGDGTIFFDEIADLPKSVQGKLLRVLEDRVFVRLGSSQERPINARLLGATRRDLSEMVATGQLREDLYFRLTVLEIELPPLRDRREDIPELLQHFLRQLDFPCEGSLPADVLRRLQEHAFPGNVRELRNIAERIRLLAPGLGRMPRCEELGLRPHPVFKHQEDDGAVSIEIQDRELDIGRALTAAGGRIGEAARALGVSRHALRRMLKKTQDRELRNAVRVGTQN